MDIWHQTAGNVEVLKLAGRFDASQVSKVVEWYSEHPDVRYMVVSMTGVSFIDSSGLSTLVKGLKLCRQNEGELCLCDMQPPVRLIFEQTRLDKAFRVFSDEASAIIGLSQ